MFKKIFFIASIFCTIFIMAQENFEISTLRIGPYKIFMKPEDASQLAGKKLSHFEDWEKSNSIFVEKEKVEIKLSEIYNSQTDKVEESVYMISTKSPKFRTKSKMGVGSTKLELTEAYKNMPNFEMTTYTDDKGKKVSFFSISDTDAGTYLTFKLEENKVVEVMVGVEEGC